MRRLTLLPLLLLSGLVAGCFNSHGHYNQDAGITVLDSGSDIVRSDDDGRGGAGVAGAGANGGKGGGAGGSPGTGGATAICQGSSAQCSSAKIQTCTSGQWGPASDCPTHQGCTGAPGVAKCTCIVDPVCKGATNTCATTSTLATCTQDSNGCFYQSASMACGANRMCTGSSCMCTAGTMDCGPDGCLNLNGSDSNHCGTCTNVCPAGQSCNAGKCTCAKGAPACGGCLAWDFEWGANPSPWSLAASPGITAPNGSTNIGITQSRAHAGSASLIAPIQIDSGNTNIAEVSISLPCQVNLSGYTGSLYMYLAGSYPLTDFGNQLIVDTWSSSGALEDHVVPFFGNIPTNEWFKVDLGFLSSHQVDHIGIILTPSASWTGTMYVDDVVINGL